MLSKLSISQDEEPEEILNNALDIDGLEKQLNAIIGDKPNTKPFKDKKPKMKASSILKSKFSSTYNKIKNDLKSITMKKDQDRNQQDREE